MLNGKKKTERGTGHGYHGDLLQPHSKSTEGRCDIGPD